MSEVVQTMIDDVQRDPSAYRIAAYCHADNAASAGVMRHCGLEFEGRLARYATFPNLGPEPRDCLMFAKAVR
jgi:ribosomal-protein-alanine N-acetyltransferase